MNEARKVFTTNYKMATFTVRGPFNDGIGIDNQEPGPQLMITLNNYDVIKLIFTNFGDLIMRLSLSFRNIPLDQGKQIVKIINAKAFATLEWLYLYDCWGDMFDEFKSTFKNVEMVTFTSRPTDEDIFHTDTKLHKLFPNLKKLNVAQTRPSD